MRTSRVARVMSYLYSSSVHTFVSVAGVTAAPRILPASSGQVVGSDGMQAASFMYPQKN